MNLIKVTFKTHTGEIWKTGSYKTMKRARSVHDRENLKYGAHLIMIIEKQGE